MNTKEKLKNDIIVGMSAHLDYNTIAILEAVIVKAVQNLDIKELETLPATIDNTNQYIIDLFWARKAPKISKKTADYYMSTVNEFIACVNKPLNKVVETDIEYYLYQKQPNNNNVSLNNLRRNLSAFFNWMRKTKLIADNPCDGIEPFMETIKPIEHLEAQDTEKLKAGCRHKRDRAIIEFMRSTALRRGEVPKARICDIDFKSGKIVIYGEKTRKYRTVYLDGVALYYIKEYLKDRGVDERSTEPLFTHIRGDKTKVLETEGLYASIKTIAKRAGMDKRVYPHLFRKTTATNICRRGGSEDAAGEYLGHAPKSVTGKHYTFKSEQHVEQIFHNYVEAV